MRARRLIVTRCDDPGAQWQTTKTERPASAATIAASYIFGGLIPLAPYMIFADVSAGLRYSVVITLCALALFGYVKSRFTGLSPWKGATQPVVIGGLAAAAAFGLAKLVQS